MAKPFSSSQLSARVRALVRRSHLPSESLLIAGDLKLDRVQRKVERAGSRSDLTTKAFSLLEYLLLNTGRRVTRSMIIEHVWKLAFDTTTNVVDVYINYLRRKIDDGHSAKPIHTVRGVGYELSRPPDLQHLGYGYERSFWDCVAWSNPGGILTLRKLPQEKTSARKRQPALRQR